MSSFFLLLFIAALTWGTLKAIVEQQQFNCPNNGAPKVNETTGKPIQCLPGQSSEIVCGRGHSCFFSGFNYQCCPTVEEEEEYENDQNECPMGSYAVLNANGTSVKCDQKRQCPSASMFCSTLKSPPTCCEIFGKIKKSSASTSNEQKVDKKKQQFEKKNPVRIVGEVTGTAAIKPPVRAVTPPEAPAKTAPESIKSNKDKIVVSTVKQSIQEATNFAAECPANSIALLSEDGQPVKCNGNKSCQGTGSYCHQFSKDQSICCQQMESVKQSNTVSTTPPAIKKTDDKKAERVEAAVKDIELIDEELTPIGNVDEKRRTVGLGNNNKAFPYVYIDSDNLNARQQTGSRRVVHEGFAKAKAAKLREGDSLDLPNQNRASSEKLQKINSLKTDVEHKMKTQRFLVEQIKNGWPYDEKFFRPAEEVAVIRKDDRPVSIVHFPKTNE